ncbi:MAG: hypothetical protein NUV64_01575 [Parcubacteria group bacterium]|nr:hypothetical protein [Parcubacteria group bacterium]MCR4342733.1 hypothetical protein [Patescibacteria group bacterium]
MINSKPTQQFVPIKEVRDGVVILRDNSMRMVVMASSLNFALRSEDEQTAIIMQYQNFLNSLDFPVQIFIESSKLDIGPYLNMLSDIEKEQPNELLKVQTREYSEFIKNFVSTTDIVSKSFYLVVPYSPSGFASASGVLDSVMGIFGKKKDVKKIKSEDELFIENKVQLQQRADVVSGGLSSMGIRSVPLNTEELIELYFKLFNPGELDKSVTKQNVN